MCLPCLPATLPSHLSHHHHRHRQAASMVHRTDPIPPANTRIMDYWNTSTFFTYSKMTTTFNWDTHWLTSIYSSHDIQIFKSKTTNLTKEAVDQIFSFRQNIIQFHDRCPVLQFTGSYEAYDRSHLSTAFAIHSFYNLAMISLHSFLAPIFTGIPLNDSIPVEVIEICFRTTIHHVKSFVEMIQAFFSAGGKTSNLPPFVGYCCFATASVLASFLDQDVVLSANARGQLISCLVVLDDLQQYWIPLRRLVRRSNNEEMENVVCLMHVIVETYPGINGRLYIAS